MELRLQHLHDDAFALYSQLVVTMNWAREQIAAHDDDMEYCADIGFAMNEMDKLLKDIGVEVRRTREIAEKAAAKLWITEDLTGEPIRTEHMTATVKLKIQPAMPPKGSAEMKKLLEWMGVKDNHDAVRIHWPSLCDLITKQVEESKPIPDCIDKSKLHNPSAVLQYYKRKAVTE